MGGTPAELGPLVLISVLSKQPPLAVEVNGRVLLGHMGIPGPWVFLAMGLFFAGMGAAGGAFWFLSRRQGPLWRPMGIGLAGLAVGCLGLGTALPFVIHAG